MLDQEDIKRLREIFVTREECRDNVTEVGDRITSDEKHLIQIETYQRMTLWVLAAVGSGVIAMLVKMFFGAV